MTRDRRSDERDEEALALYLRETSRKSPLPPQVEADLLAAGRAGDPEALRAVIESHLLRAAQLAIESAPLTIDRFDAIQLANTALIALVEDDDVAIPGQRLETTVRELWNQA